MNTPTLPDGCIEEHLDYLDSLRETGVTNMFGSAPYLKEAFPDVTRNEAKNILFYWMQTYPRNRKQA